MTDTPWRDKDVLYEMYWNQELDQSQIAEKLGCSRTTIKKWFNKHNLNTRSQSDVVELAHEKKGGDSPWRDKEILEDMYYNQRMSLSEIASELGCGDEDVRRWMEKYDLDRRSLSESHKVLTPVFYTSTDGYEISCSSNAMEENPDEARIHRLVAVAEHGFDAVAGNIVHHKNGIKWDNREQNLSVMSQSEHTALHQEQKYNIEDTSYREKEILNRLYKQEQCTIACIADMYDVSMKTIRN